MKEEENERRGYYGQGGKGDRLKEKGEGEEEEK